MQSTSVPLLGENTGPIDVSSPSPWLTPVSELTQGEPVSDSERKTNLAVSEMHLWWREGSGYSGYRKVAVLLIKWADHLDEMNCGDEVRSLDELFRKSFGYYTNIVELDDITNANLQLHSAFVEFIGKHDGPDSLIIVYYTGHGSQNLRTEKLVLHPTNRIVQTRHPIQNPKHARAVWQEAEIHLIQNARCDVLSILDCCFAGDVHKSGFQDGDRTYELLSAAGKGKTTGCPGPKSFTTALIGSLSQLQKEYGAKPFTTLQLQERIQCQPERRDNPPFLWHRLHRYDRPICLAPLTDQPEKIFPSISEPSRAFLTLRIALEEESLNKDQVVALGSKITKAAKSSGAQVHRVDLLGFSISTRRRSLLQVIRSTALPFVRLKRGFKSDTSPVQTDSDTPRLPASPISQSDSLPGKISPPNRISEGRAEQIQSGHANQLLLPQESRKRNRSSISEPSNKKRRGSF